MLTLYKVEVIEEEEIKELWILVYRDYLFL